MEEGMRQTLSGAAGGSRGGCGRAKGAVNQMSMRWKLREERVFQGGCIRFLFAAVTDCHRLGGVKQHRFII